MELQCDCGQFRARLKAFPQNTPGRLRCYCDDCQSYLHYLQRPELLDAHGGTEVIPAYPADVEILSGVDKLKCIRLFEKGIHRFVASCCNTPFGNTKPKSPWIGILRRMYLNKNPMALDQAFPEVRSSIMGRYAKGTPPSGTPKTFNFKAFVSVMPFMLRGKLFGKFRHSPVYRSDATTPIAPPQVLTAEQRQDARRAAKV